MRLFLSLSSVLRRRVSLLAGMLIMLLTITVPDAAAHDPGLSSSRWLMMGNTLSVDLAMARRDIEPLLSRKRFQASRDAAREHPSVAQALEGIALTAIQLTSDSKHVAPERVEVEEYSGDGVRLRMEYRVQPGSSIRIEYPLLQELGRGHRNFVTLADAATGEQETWLLSAGHPEFEFRAGDAFSAPREFAVYLLDGVWHIWLGFDHLLFLLTLLLPAVLTRRPEGWRPVGQLRPALMEIMKTVTAFTVAHSITLSLAVLGIVPLPGRWVEVAIAASVIVAAINNLHPVLSASRWPLAFAFGLLHGFGFATVLVDAGVSSRILIPALIGFNLGVELAQVAVVLVAIPVMFSLRNHKLYGTVVLRGGSVAAAAIAGVWFVQRLFELPGPGV